MKKTYKVSGMHCSSCAMTIEWELEDRGIKAKCNYAKAELEVEIDEDNLTEEKVRVAVEKAGYKLLSLIVS